MPVYFGIVAVFAGMIGTVIGAFVGFCIGSQYDHIRQRSAFGAMGGGIGGFLLFIVASVVAYSWLPQKSIHTEWGTRTVPNVSEEVLIPVLWGASFVGSLGGSIWAAFSNRS